MKAARNIDKAWNEVTQSCIKGAWKKCLVKLQIHCNYENDIENIIEEISRVAICGGIEDVDEDDIQTLLKSHGEPLTYEELQEMDCHTYLKNDVSELVPVRNLALKSSKRLFIITINAWNC